MRSRRNQALRWAGAALMPLLASGTAAAAPNTLDLTVPFAFEHHPTEPYLPPPNSRPAPDHLHFAVSSQSDAPYPTLVFAPDARPDDLFRFMGSEGATRTVSLRAKDIQLDPGTLDLASAFGQRNLADDVTVDRLMLPGAFEAESVSTLYAGAKGTWFKHLSFAAAGAVSEASTVANAAFRDVDPAEAARERTAGALWLGARAEFGDAKGLRWTFVTQYGGVDKDFRAAGAASARPEGAVAIAGDRIYAMTRVTLGDFALSAANQTLSRDDMDVASRRLTLAHDWVNLTVAARSVARPSSDTHSDTVSAAVEFYPSTIAPEVGQLAPALVTVETANQTTRANTITGEDRRSLVSVNAVWTTGLGETIVSYWRGAPDTLVDATHNLAWRDWRLFGGVTTMAFHDDTTADTSLIAHGGVAYRPDDGMQIEWALQRTRNEITDVFDDDPFDLERLEMRVAIDAAPLLRTVFGMDAATAKLEYRQTIDRYAASGDTPSDAAAIAATFAAPL